MDAKWLISINPEDGRNGTKLHGPFASKSEVAQKGGEIASDLDYPDDLVFAAFEIIAGEPVLFFDSDHTNIVG